MQVNISHKHTTETGVYAEGKACTIPEKMLATSIMGNPTIMVEKEKAMLFWQLTMWHLSNFKDTYIIENKGTVLCLTQDSLT